MNRPEAMALAIGDSVIYSDEQYDYLAHVSHRTQSMIVLTFNAGGPMNAKSGQPDNWMCIPLDSDFRLASLRRDG